MSHRQTRPAHSGSPETPVATRSPSEHRCVVRQVSAQLLGAIRGFQTVSPRMMPILVALCAVSIQSAAFADPLGAGSGMTYVLTERSNLREGCFEPCLCPILVDDGLRGTFGLAYLGNHEGIDTYAVQDVNWVGAAADGQRRVVGGGVYRIGSPDVITLLQHRLELDLRVDDEEAQHFDSGWVPIEEFAGIHIAVAMNGFYCWDRVFNISATVVPDDRVRRYTLADSATFQRGCYDPCDCPLEPSRPIAGSFTLVAIENTPLRKDFAIVDVEWQALSTSASDSLPIRGFGWYRLQGEFAPEHRLNLELRVGSEPSTHFDSGMVFDAVEFPRIDATVSIHGMECFDTVLHVVADPKESLCGGIAGIPCREGEFCKLPLGACCCDFMGVCVPIPTACPTVWLPVCGCDGVTYGNECEADAAGVSVEHQGECELVCQPTDDGFACVSLPCSPVVEADCRATVVHLDVESGAISVRACDCLHFTECHVAFGNAVPYPVGNCPDGAVCEVVGADTDNDGIDDTFTAGCVPVPLGACCFDVDDGPVPYDTCMALDERSCIADGGLFHEVDTACSEIQACCLVFSGDGFCTDLNPHCCADSNGVPQGPGSTCDNSVGNGGCGRICGGFAGDTCSAGEFCKFPEGICNDAVDRTGVCTPIPNACPEIYDPVCGCDGVTYGNECEADAVGVSILHDGECGVAACCLPDGSCVDLSPDRCVDEGGEPLPGARCEVVDCAPLPTGACCLSDAAGTTGCFVGTAQQCEREGGAYSGDGTTCPTDPSLPCTLPESACCLPDGACMHLEPEVCRSKGGEPITGVRCDVVFCTPAHTGACCVGGSVGDLACFVGTPEECNREGGVYQGDDTICPTDTNLPCEPPTGACCLPSSDATVTQCLVLTRERCVSEGGAYLGDGATCPDDPVLACPAPCPALCGVFECVSGCGTIVQGTECLLFEAAWGTFVLSDLGPFGVGDRVFVTGCVEPFCVSTCQEGDGCIQNFGITACGEVCGGIAGIPCDNDGEFCKFADGTCNIADNLGLCTPVPGGGCPRIYDPICGCDGNTYPNECESDAAAVSIDHRGACLDVACVAKRVLGEPDMTYCPSQPKTVRIFLDPPTGTTAIAVEDSPPSGWAVTEISEGGSFDATNGKVKWGPFFAPFPQQVWYVIVPDSDVGAACFQGVVSVDGINQSVCGDGCVEACCPHIPADQPQAMCAACDTSGCGDCEDDCANGVVTLCEFVGYACAWMNGCNDDLAGMTRAAFLWRHGECYCWSDVEQNWFPTNCDDAASVCCAADSTPSGAAVASEATGSAFITWTTARNRKGASQNVLEIPVTIQAPLTATAVALEIDVPQGWVITSQSAGGSWDAIHRKAKWGPFFDELSRTVTFEMSAVFSATGTARRLTDSRSPRGISGTVSFDGLNQPVGVKRVGR